MTQCTVLNVTGSGSCTGWLDSKYIVVTFIIKLQCITLNGARMQAI